MGQNNIIIILPTVLLFSFYFLHIQMKIGMTIKVTIVNRDEREQQNLITRRNNMISMQMQTCVEDMPLCSPEVDSVNNGDRLTFHPVCGSHATVTQSGRTALRPR